MEAVAPGNVLTVDAVDIALLLHANQRVTSIDIVQRNLATFKAEIGPVVKPAADEVFDHFLLAVDGHRSSSQFYKRNAMKPAVQAQLDPLVAEAFALQPPGNPCLSQHFNACVFQDSGANTLLAIGALLRLQYDGSDAMLVEQVREH
jgi:hypothetical protein